MTGATREAMSPVPILAVALASIRLVTAGVSVLGALAVGLGGCQPGEQPGSEYMPDMARGPSYQAFAPNEAMRNGITLQRPVAGTIARGYRPFHYSKGESEAIRAGDELANPFHATPQVLDSGKALYQTYCLVCHGAEGKGDGPIAGKIPPPTSYRSERLLAYPPGRMFHVITLGANKMPSYAVQLTPDERWWLITYIRTQLQGLPDSSGSVPSTPTGTPAAPTGTPAAPTGTPAAPTGTPAPTPPGNTVSPSATWGSGGGR